MRNFKYKIIVTVVLLSNSLFGQQITTGEYFFNNDPGLGNGTSFAISETNGEFTKVIDASIADLASGFNTFYVRAKQNNAWGNFERSLFYISSKFKNEPSNSPVVKAEYFFDADPGLGKGQNIILNTSGVEINQVFTVDISNLSAGFHTVYFRLQSENKKWSIFERALFYVSQEYSKLEDSPITKAEYFIDTDPGLGKGSVIALGTSSNEISQTFTVDVSSLSAGFHTVYFRVKNDNNQWSMFERALFYISKSYSQPAESPIVSAEYYFNEFTDPGTGTSIALVTNSEGNFETDINTGTLTEGEHLLFVRAKNEANIWSLYDVVAFTIDNSLGIDKILAKDFNVYPNAVKEIINIKTQHTVLSYKIYDIQGKIIQNNKLLNNKIDATNLNAGVYFLTLKTDKGTFVKKIMKE